jgi:hypothetical protein
MKWSSDCCVEDGEEETPSERAKAVRITGSRERVPHGGRRPGPWKIEALRAL